MDPFEGFSHEPLTLHKYLYAGADPVNKTDATGELLDTGSQLQTVLIANQIRAQSTVSYAPTIRVVATVLLAVNIVTAAIGMLPIDPNSDQGNRGRYWQLFRLVTSLNPIENFISRKALGMPPTPVEEEDDFIYGGLSTWDRLDRAQDTARRLRRYRPVFGIAELWIPVGVPGVDIRRTLRSRGHYTVVGPPELLFRSWRHSHLVL